MVKLDYAIRVHEGREDEVGFWVEVPALPGCFTQGNTYEEALSNAEEAIRCYVESLLRHGEPVPPAQSQVSEIRVEPSHPLDGENPLLDEFHLTRAHERAGFVNDGELGNHLVLYHPVSKVRTVLFKTKVAEYIETALLAKMIELASLTEDYFDGLLDI